MASTPPTDIDLLTRLACFGTDDGVYHVYKKCLYFTETTLFIDSILHTPAATREAITRLRQIFEQKSYIRKEPLLYALARIVQNLPKNSDDEISVVRNSAYQLSHSVCETSEDLFTFLDYDKKLSTSSKLSTGRGVRNLIKHFYDKMTALDLVQEVTRCKSGRNLTHRDVIKMAHLNPSKKSKDRQAVLEYLLYGRKCLDKLKADDDPAVQEVVNVLKGVESLNATSAAEKEVVRCLVEQYSLQDRQIPSWCREHAETYEGLLGHMTLDQIVHSIPRMANLGMLDPISDFSPKIIERLKDLEEFRASKLSAVAVFSMLKKYEGSGNLLKKYIHNYELVKALTAAYNMLIKCRPMSNKRYLLAVHVNPKNSKLKVVGSTYLSPIAISSLLVQQFLQSAETADAVFFNQDVTELPVNRNMTTIEICEKILDVARSPSNETVQDMSKPFVWATNNRKAFDRIVVITDKKTTPSAEVFMEAMAAYRTNCEPLVKVAVIGLSDTNSIPSPMDFNYLDVCGFDESVPVLVDKFFDGVPDFSQN